MSRNKLDTPCPKSLSGKLLFIPCLLIALGCGGVNKESNIRHFVKNPVGQESKSNKLAPVIGHLSASAGVPANKLSGYQGQYEAVGESGAKFSVPFESLKYNNLTEPEFNSLRAYLNKGHLAPNTSAPKPNGELSDLLPPHMQALEGKRFVLRNFEQGPFTFTVATNCWTTSYELTRLRVSGGFDFNVFYTDGDIIDKAFANNSVFDTVSTRNPSELENVIKEAAVGDILNFFESKIIHSAVVVAPGLVFEKQGPASEAFYRLRTLEGVLSDWPGIASIKIVRAKGTQLPHPLTFVNAPMGGNVITYSESTKFAIVSPLPSLVPATGPKNGKWELPGEAFDVGTFRAVGIPGRALNLSGPWSEYVSKECTLKSDVQAKSAPWASSDNLGQVSRGTVFQSTERSFNYIKAAMVTTIEGRLLSGRALRPGWFALADLECK